MLNIIINNYNLNKQLNIFIKHKYIYLNFINFFFFYKLPKYFLFKNNKNKQELILINKQFYNNIIMNFFLLYNRLIYIYIVRLKLKGLGFRIRKISNNLYYFFFNYTNMYYFNIPNNILIKWYKKRLILLSNDFILLKNIFTHILLLKKIGTYRLIGIRYPRQILLLKKGGKKL